MSTPLLSRREMLAALAAAAAQTSQAAPGKLQLVIFSKHLQWGDWQEAAATAKEIGFDGIDWTVREGGHILPEKVEQDLPKAVEIAQKAGLGVPMITAGIVDAKTPRAEAMLKTASGLGIRNYRWGGFTYSYDKDIAAQLEALKPRVAGLAELNAKYNMCAMYHTHSGARQVGAPIWDLWTVLRDMDPRYVGFNYDVGHATVEGGLGGWIDSAHLLRKHMKGIALKDFKWVKNAKGAWTAQWCPIGEGMVNFPAFFEIIRTQGFNGPVQVHYEYPGIGGADNGRGKLGIPKEQLVAIMRKDLDALRTMMVKAQLV